MYEDIDQKTAFLGNDSFRTMQVYSNKNNRHALLIYIKETLEKQVNNFSLYRNDTLIYYFNAMLGMTRSELLKEDIFEELSNSNRFWFYIRDFNKRLFIFNYFINVREKSLRISKEEKIGNSLYVQLKFNDDSILNILSKERSREY